MYDNRLMHRSLMMSNATNKFQSTFKKIGVVSPDF